MLQTLTNELHNMQSKSKQQDQRIKNLYISFQEIYKLLNNQDNHTSTKHNILNKMRPEVFNQVLIFLDIKQILRFRLVSRRARELVKLMLPKQINNIQQQIADQQNEIQLKIQNLQEGGANDQNLQQILNAALDGVSTLNKAHISMVKCYARPPELVGRIINFVCIILDPTFKIQIDNWKECKKFLSRLDFLELIINLDINSISDNQLQQIEQVKTIQEQQAAAISIAAGSLLMYLKAVLELRQSKLYMTQNAIKQLESKIKREQQLIEKLEKILNK